MLAQVRANSPDGEPASPREVLASPVGEQRAAELISEAAIVVDSAGTALAPPPAAKPATAPWQAASVADEPAAPRLLPPRKTPAASPPEPEKQKAPPPQGKPARRPSGFPGFDAYSDLRAKECRDEEVRAKKVEAARAQGRCQISATESFPPDPRKAPRS